MKSIVCNVRKSGLLIVAAGLLMLPAVASFAQGTAEPRIEVTGVGTSHLAPDLAILNLTVRREGKTARKALDANSAAMKEVLAAMEDEGIASRDLQTTNFSIEPRYVYPPAQPNTERKPPRIVGYTVRNDLTVRVRDISRVGAILDRSVSLGVNEGGNISFGNDDPSGALTEARTNAVSQALQKAETLAAAAGVELGPILLITEHSNQPWPQPIAKAQRMMAVMEDAVPVASGENSYTVTVALTMGIEQ